MLAQPGRPPTIPMVTQAGQIPATDRPGGMTTIEVMETTRTTMMKTIPAKAAEPGTMRIIVGTALAADAVAVRKNSIDKEPDKFNQEEEPK